MPLLVLACHARVRWRIHVCSQIKNVTSHVCLQIENVTSHVCLQIDVDGAILAVEAAGEELDSLRQIVWADSRRGDVNDEMVSEIERLQGLLKNAENACELALLSNAPWHDSSSL